MARVIQGIVTKYSLTPTSMVVVNKAGGAGAEGFLDIKASRGNPHKLIITLSNLFTTPLATGVPFNWRDLTPVSMMALDQFVLWDNVSGPKTVKRAGEDADDDTTFAAAERRLKLAQAIKVERENDIALGNLIEIDKLEPIWQRILSRVRGSLLKLPTAVAPLVVGDMDAHSIQLKIKDAVHDALTNLSEDWRDEETEDAG